jgi:hypothetical protein
MLLQVCMAAYRAREQPLSISDPDDVVAICFVEGDWHAVLQEDLNEHLYHCQVTAQAWRQSKTLSESPVKLIWQAFPGTGKRALTVPVTHDACTPTA